RLEGAIRARPKTERGATVRHVNAERFVVREHEFEITQLARRVAGVMRRAPGIKPTGIKFATHQRSFRKHFAQGFEAAGRVGAKIHYGKKIRTKAVFQIVGRVACEQRDVESRVNERLAQLTHILNILAEKAVFVFDLDHENWA